MEPPRLLSLWQFAENLCEDFTHAALGLRKVGIKRGKIREIGCPRQQPVVLTNEEG